MTQLYDCREAFARALEAAATEDDRIFLVVNDSISSSNARVFALRWPDRLINVGIAEQNMIGVAAGLANSGKLPFVCGASCFITARALEQIKVDVAYSFANVKLCGFSSGVAYGALGPTHHSIEDVAWIRAIPDLTVIVPADPIETEQAVASIVGSPTPVFLRLSRMGVPAVHDAGYKFFVSKAVRLRPGTDLTIIAAGVMVSRALDAATLLSWDGIEARVVNMSTLQPIDADEIVAAAKDTGAIVTVEEGTVRGGLGAAVAEVVVQNCPVPMKILGIPGQFAPTGTASEILEHFQLTPQGIARVARALIGYKEDEVRVGRRAAVPTAIERLSQ